MRAERNLTDLLPLYHDRRCRLINAHCYDAAIVTSALSILLGVAIMNRKKMCRHLLSSAKCVFWDGGEYGLNAK